MKVILTTELKGRGGEGDVVDVARGFAVNYLLPRGMAIVATPGNLKQLEQRMHNIKKREETRLGDANSFSSSLEGKTVRIEMLVGDNDRLFGSVTALMVAEAILEQHGIEVDRRKIELRGAIKTLGEHAIDIAVYRDIKAAMTVNVVAQGSVEEVAEAVVAEEVVAEEAPAEEAVVEVAAEEVVAEEAATEEVAAEDSAE